MRRKERKTLYAISIYVQALSISLAIFIIRMMFLFVFLVPSILYFRYERYVVFLSTEICTFHKNFATLNNLLDSRV